MELEPIGGSMKGIDSKFIAVLLLIISFSSSSYAENCIASQYGIGDGYHRKRTASGSIFNTWALTAAHKILPFGTRVAVTNLRNGRSVIVLINDRGPFVRGRCIDLSRAAINAIGMGGTEKVSIR